MWIGERGSCVRPNLMNKFARIIRTRGTINKQTQMMLTLALPKNVSSKSKRVFSPEIKVKVEFWCANLLRNLHNFIYGEHLTRTSQYVLYQESHKHENSSRWLCTQNQIHCLRRKRREALRFRMRKTRPRKGINHNVKHLYQQNKLWNSTYVKVGG